MGKKLLNLNMKIAWLHEVTTQLIGMQLSSANILALAVSATSVVAGTVSTAAMFYPGSYLLWLVAGLIGAGLAVLIEGLTVGALIRIRLANKKIREVRNRLQELRDIELNKIERPLVQADRKAFQDAKKTYQDACNLVEDGYKRNYLNATAEMRQARFWSCVIAFFGATASACAGGMFYHTLLAHLVWYQSLAFSALFALAVTVTFVSSKLFKDEQELAIREGFKGGALTETAIKQETTRMTYRGVYDESVSFMQTDEAKKLITEGFKDVLLQVMSEMKQDTDTGHQVIVTEVTPATPAITIGQRTPATPAITIGQRTPANRTPNRTRKAANRTQGPDTKQETGTGQQGTINRTQDSGQQDTQDITTGQIETWKPDTETGQPDIVEPANRTPETGQESDLEARIISFRAAEPGVTQKEVADKLGVSERTVRRHWHRTPDTRTGQPDTKRGQDTGHTKRTRKAANRTEDTQSGQLRVVR